MEFIRKVMVIEGGLDAIIVDVVASPNPKWR
jgi:hypothetical protein